MVDEDDEGRKERLSRLQTTAETQKRGNNEIKWYEKIGYAFVLHKGEQRNHQ
jgi:hypothetical protein